MRYRYIIIYQGTAIILRKTRTLKTVLCVRFQLEALFTQSYSANDGIVPHSTLATFNYSRFSGQSEVVSLNGEWRAVDTYCASYLLLLTLTIVHNVISVHLIQLSFYNQLLYNILALLCGP